MMPVYAADGTTKINYTLSEAAIPGYDTKVIEEVPFSGGIMAVVNTYQVTKLTGSKVWVDDGKTHNNATEVTLTVNYQRYDSAGNPVGEPGTVTDPVISWGTTEATKNNYEVGGLPVGDGKGNTYRYWAVETPITGYNTSCKNADDPATEHVDESTITGYALNGGIITNTAKVGDVTITKTFVDDEGNAIAIPAEVLEDFNIIVDYTEVKDGASASKTETLEVKDGTPSADGKTYTWEITDVAYGTEVHVHEQNYLYIDGYDFDGSEVTVSVPDANKHDDDTGFTMPDGEVTVGFTNEYIEQTGWIRLIKLWDDDSNRDGKRPGEVTFKVTATYKDDNGNPVPAPVFDDGKSEKTVTFDNDGDTAADTWSYENLGNLPLYYKGNEVTYKVDEPNVPAEYTKDIIGSEGINLIPYEEEMLAIINKYEPETGSVKVTKTWDDDNNKAGLRAEAKVYLYADGTLVGEVTEGTVTTTDGEVKTWSDLPVYTADGTDGNKKIRYTVKETAVPGYTTSFSYAPEPGVELVENATEPSTIAITNKHVPETGELTIKKVWDDDNDQDGFRADSITVTLYAKTIDGAEAKVFNGASDKDVTVSAADGWKYEFTGDTKLPATYDGKAVIYYVDGDTETFDGGDKSKYTHTFVERTGDTEITVTNIHKPEEGCVEVLKVWDDNNNQDGKRQDAVMTLNGTTGTGDTAETTTVGKKTISADINEPQEAVWHDQPVYRNGEKITYTVEEAEIDGYTPSVSDPVQLDGDNDTKKITVTNTYEPETTSVTVIKKWKDGDDQDKKRSDVTMHLKGIIEGAEFKSLNFEDKIIPVNTTAKDGEDAGTATWTDLPVYHDGKKITYDVTEEAVPGYTSNVEMSEGHATVTNERATDVTYVEVTKVWNDADNVDGMRTDVTVTLEKTVDGKKSDVDSKTIATGDNHDENMTASWSGLPANEDGKPITYTVREDDINGYTGETSSTEPGKFTITNIHEPEKTNVKVTKVWDDNNNADRLRPNSVNVVLYADGKPVEIKSITTPEDAQTESKVTFTVPKNRTGAHDEAITYTVKEEKVPEGYTASEPTGDQHKGYTITNTHVTETASLKITKTWYDKKNAEGLRPDSVTFHLYKKTDDGQVSAGVEAKTIAADADHAEAQWDDLPVYENGEKITYVVVEEAVAGYKTEYDGTQEVQLDGTTGAQLVNVTNSITPATANVAVTKIWDDESNRDGKRPADGVKFKLYERVWDPEAGDGKGAYGAEAEASYADGKKVPALTLDGKASGDTTNEWKGEFTNLPATKNGKTVIYYVKEETDLTTENYKAAVVTGNQIDGYEITNSRNRDTTSASITKIWLDSSARFMRPDTLELELWRYYEGADGNLAYERVTADADGNAVKTTISYDDALEGDEDRWAITVPNLPVNNEQGKAYTYYWKEAVPANYETPSIRPEDYPAPDDPEMTERIVQVANGGSILNVLSTFEVRVNKIWADGNDREGKRQRLARLYLEATTDDPEAVDAEWKLVGNAYVQSNDNHDGQVPVTNWYSGRETIDSNGKIILPVAEDGDVITYRLTERDQGNEYTTSYKLANSDDVKTGGITFTFRDTGLYSNLIGVNVTNSLDPDFSVTKKWVDEEGNTVRPRADKYKESLKLFATEFTLNNETLEYDQKTIDVTEKYADKLEVEDNEDGTYTATWKALPQYGEDGPVFDGSNRIIYHVKETKVDGYEDAAYSNTEDPASETKEAEATDKAYDHGVITNTQSIPQRTIKVTKVWDDEDILGTDGYVRPKDVSVQLYKGEGEDEEAYGDPVGLSEANKWTYSWSVPAEANGKPIAYTIKEVNVPAGFTSSGDVKVSADQAEEGYTITNTPKPGEKVNSIDLVVVKTNKKDDVLAGAEFKVTAPSGTTETYTSDDNGELQITFEEEGEYTIEETKAPDGYKAEGKKYTVAVTRKKVEVKYDKAEDSWKTIYDLIFNKIAGNTQERNTAGTALVVGNPPNTHTLTVVKNYSGIEKLPDTFAIDVTYTDAEGKEVPVKLNAAQGTAAAGSVTWTISDVPYGSSVNVTEKGYEAARYTVKADGSKSLIMPDADAPVTLKNEYTEQDKITIKYTDGQGKDITSKEIYKGDGEPDQSEIEIPEREGFEFVGWERKVDKEGNVTYEAQWKEVPESDEITITYKDGEKTVVTETIKAGEKEPAQPADPEKREGQTFAGWDKVQDDDGNITYMARWIDDPEPGEMTITYMDGDKTVVKETIKVGDKEPAQPADPEKKEGKTFAGWDKVQDDDGNITYTARWIDDPETAKTITYIDPMADNALIKSKHEGEAGANIDPEGTPAHDDMDFVKWDEVKDADGNIIRFARYVPNCDNVQNKTLVRYRSIDGEKEDVYQTSYINEGDDIPPYAGDEPVREGYLFDGWGDPEYVKDDEGKITDIFITAKWKEVPKVKTHTVKYVDPDGHTIYLEKTGVKEGDKVDPPENPTREGYDFDGWTDPVTDPDTGDVTYTAKWKEKPPVPEKTHTVEYVDEDGTVYYGPVTVKEGEKEPDAPDDPKKDGYIFGGWIRNVDKDGNVTYTAKWLPDTHTVTYVDGRTGKVIEVVPDIPLHGDAKVPDAPAHEGYEFKGWRTPDGELVTDLKVKDVIRDLVYTAVYDPTEKPVPLVHTVTFIDSITGDEIKVDNNVPDGGSTATPVVPDHQDENYVFKGWWTQDNELVTDLQVEDVREDQIYVAIYDRVYQEAVIGKRIIHFRYIDKEGREVEDDRVDSVRFTRTATVDGITGETTFSEWTPRYHTFPEEDVPVVEGYTTKDTIPEQTVWPNGKNEELWVIYTPVATEETKTVSRTVKFRYYTVDGEEASADVVQTVTLKSSWTIDPDTKERVYTDWEITGREQEDPQIPEIEGFTPDMTKVPEFVVDLKDPKDGEDVVVIYSKIPQKTFTVTFTDGFGNELKVQEGIPEHGSAVEPVVPDRKGYRFAGWDVAFDDVTGDMTVTATWQKVRTVIYQDPDGTIHQEDIVDYDDKDPAAPKDIAKNGFIFDGWDKKEDEHGNVIYTARWIPEPQPDTFWVTYVDEDGTVYLEKTTVKKGDKEPDQPKVSKDGYIFGGWNRIVDKDGNVTYTAVWFKAENPDNPENPENPVVPQQSDKSAAPNGTNVTTITNPVTGKPMTVVRPESTGGAYTGDNNGTLLWIILAVASAGAGLTAIAIRRRRQRED
jgi:uncharacterized repeat protein (TIGR02543 family)